MACLVLKEFFRTDYRSLADHPELVRLIDLKDISHYTIFQAADRLLRVAPARESFGAVLARAGRK